MIVSHPGSNPGRVLLPFTPNDMLCDSVFSPSQCILAVGKVFCHFFFFLFPAHFCYPGHRSISLASYYFSVFTVMIRIFLSPAF